MRLARQSGDRKLYGTRMMHFAAFGLPEWRAWDWTAGRLDAQVHLARALLPEDDDTRKWLTDWLSNVQAGTVETELGRNPAAWSQERQELRTVENEDLIGRLQSTSKGEHLLMSVVDAAMRPSRIRSRWARGACCSTCSWPVNRSGGCHRSGPP